MRGGAARVHRVRLHLAVLCMLLALLSAVRAAHADPWASPGNAGLRNDLELLVDSGVINVPVTTWPIPWGSVAAQLRGVRPDRLSPMLQASYYRVEEQIRQVQDGGIHTGYEAAGAPGRPAMNWFGNTTRGKESIGASVAGTEGVMAFRLNVRGVWGSRDHQRGRLDGSYLSLALGNWIVSAGALDQWWGPGWSGSLVLGTNSRPPPALSITRNVAEPFATPLLHWLGPWTMTIFNARLDNAYVPANAWLLGQRVAFRPARNLEIGLSRTALWGGAGQPNSPSEFGQVFLLHSRAGGALLGDNRAEVDLRWSFALAGRPFDFYTQGLAEQLAHLAGGLIPIHDFLGLVGVSTWGPVGDAGGSYRTFLEYTDTAVGFLSSAGSEYNFAYEGGPIYQTGYRYRGYSLGYPTDNDSALWTTGLMLEGVDGGELTFLLRGGVLNRDNSNVPPPGGNPYAPVRTGYDEMDAYYRPSFWGGALEIGLGVTRWAPFGLPVKTGPHALLSWQVNFP